MKTKSLTIAFILLSFIALFSGFKRLNDLTGTWVLSKATYREFINNNTSFDSLSNYDSNDMVIYFDNEKYQLFENNELSDSSTYRKTENQLIFESANILPNNYQVEKLTPDSLVLFLETNFYNVDDNSTFVTKRRLHFYKQGYN